MTEIVWVTKAQRSQDGQDCLYVQKKNGWSNNLMLLCIRLQAVGKGAKQQQHWTVTLDASMVIMQVQSCECEFVS